jgi:GH15 family glucan-1,4-alpha-glucosidase
MSGAGYAPIRDYAAIGDGRTVGLVGRNGHIDWLALPMIDSASVFADVLDDARGGSFVVEPDVPYRSEHRYFPSTNVLDTTFHTREGVVRVTDAVTMDNGALLPWTEIARRIEPLAGAVPMRWRIAPRFDFARHEARFETVRGLVHAYGGSGDPTVVTCPFDAGEVSVRDHAVEGEFLARVGRPALIALASVHSGPVARPHRDAIERRIDDTVRSWAAWSQRISYNSPWHDAVLRSALALRMLLFTPTGALAAAPTTSLPEQVRGTKNYDYRYSWLRDTSFALDALLRLDLQVEVQRMTQWLSTAFAVSAPWCEVFSKLGGSTTATEPEGELDLAGYLRSRPVRIGNSAADQLQIGTYGDVFETLWLYYRSGNELDGPTAEALTTAADYLCRIWSHRDAGIWELHDRRHYTTSKMGAWVALDRALRFARCGVLPCAHAPRWQATLNDIVAFLHSECWSDERQSYTMAANDERLDAACLLASRTGFEPPASQRMLATIRAIRSELQDGPLVYRYTGAASEENAFIACSFWLARALTAAGELDEAAAILDGMVALGNDVGLYSEEIDPVSGAMYGNFPQALSHLALVIAASTFDEAQGAS